MAGDINFKKLSAIAFVVVLFVLAVFIIKPIVIAIVTGLLAAYILMPFYARICSFVKEKNVAALIVIILVFLVIFLPLWFLMPIILKQLFEIFLNTQTIDMIAVIRDVFPDRLLSDTFVVNINAALTNLISTFANFISSQVTSFLLNLPNILLQTLIFFFTLFYSMRDAEKLKLYIKNISPFSSKIEKKLLSDFKDITNSVIFGSIIVGIVLGIVMGVGFLIFKVPNALILTILSAFAAIIPVLGVWVIWVPVTLFLLTTGHVGQGVGLAIYSILTTFALESLIRSYFISKKSRLHSAVGLIGMIGGLFVFGLLGIVLGPIILSYLIILLEAFRQRRTSPLFS